MKKCNNLEFLIGNIKDFDKLQNVDLIFSLHACNTTTNYVLLKGLELGAKSILAVKMNLMKRWVKTKVLIF